MICEECKNENKTSTITVGLMTMTNMYSPPFYDEVGAYHEHNPNWRTTNYTCSNGHKFTKSKLGRCPANGCDYGAMEE